MPTPRSAPALLAFALAAASPAAAQQQQQQSPQQQSQQPPAATPNGTAGAPTATGFTPTAAPNRPGLRSWTADRRDFAVGDVVTVLIDDYTISSAIKDDLAQQRRRRDLGANVNVNQGAGASTNVNAAIGTRNDGDTQQRGEARRENRFQSEMSVRIVAVGPRDTYQVRGTRLIDVDKGKQNIVLTGWIRAQDVTAVNTIESARIADAQLAYQSPGPLGRTKSGLLTRVVGLVWP